MTAATLANLRKYRLTATELHDGLWCIHAGSTVIARGYSITALNHWVDGYATAMATIAA